MWKIWVWFFLILYSNKSGVKHTEDLFNIILWKDIQKRKQSFHFNYFYSKLPTSHLGFSLTLHYWLCFTVHSFSLFTVHFGKGFSFAWVWFLVMSSEWDRICPCWWEIRFHLILEGYSFIWLQANACLQVYLLLLNHYKGCSSFFLCSTVSMLDPKQSLKV